MNIHQIAKLGVISSLLSVSWTSAGFSQPTPEAAPQVETVIVTAQKRAENIQDVPIAVQAFTAKQIRASKVEVADQLQLLTPALNYHTIAANSQPFLRGIGNDQSYPNADPGVATYIDGAYVDNTKGIDQNLLYLDHVEVLEGPQGTLYGRNAVGGAINIVTRTPGDTPSQDLTVEYGNFAEKLIRGYVEQPLSDDFFLGVYAYAQESDPYVHNLVSVPNDVGHESNWGGRIKAVWDATNDLRFTLSADYARPNDILSGAFRQVQPNAVGYVLGAPYVNKPYVTSLDFPSHDYDINESFNFRTDYDAGFAKVMNMFTARQVIDRGSTDFDGTSAPVFGFGAGCQCGKTWTEESQVQSPNESKIVWIAGLYALWEKAGFTPTGVPYGLTEASGGVTAAAINSAVDTTAYAAYAQVTVPLWDTLRLTAGGRLNYESKDWDSPTLTVPGGVTFTYPSTANPDRQHHWDSGTPKLTLDYRYGDTLFYATYSKGYISGAYNVSAPQIVGQGDLLNPESLFDYEIGTKSDFFDHRLRVNNSAYYYVYKSIQTTIINPATCGSTCLINAGGAHMYGFETSIDAVLTEELSATAGLSLEHTAYTGFGTPGCNNPQDPCFAGLTQGAVGNSNLPVDLTGKEVQRAPTVVFTFGSDYTHVFPAGDELTLHADVYYNGGFKWGPQGTIPGPYYIPEIEKAYTLLGASARYQLADSRFSIMIWGRNLTNTYYHDIVNVNTLGTDVLDAPPRTFGVTLNYHVE